MAGNSSHSQTLTLSNVAQQLRLFKSSLARNYSSNPFSGQRRDSAAMAASRKRSAVLICIFQGVAGDLRVILTLRSSSLSSHSGEVSLPGGKMDADDEDEVATALREAKEEIGLDPTLVDVVCTLDSFTTTNDMVVVPVVGLLHDKAAFDPAPNVGEVEAIFDAPLEMFLKDDNRREVEREWVGEKYLLQCFDYEFEDKKYVIFGLTARILIQTASMVFQRPPGFPVMRPKF